MPRTLTGAALAAAQNRVGQKLCHLIFLQLGSGDIRITTNDVGLAVDVGDGNGNQAWNAIGGRIEVDPVAESGDHRKNSVTVVLPAVEQSTVAGLLGGNYMGRLMGLWRAYMTGASVTATVRLNRYIISEAEISERRGERDATAEVRIRGLGRLAYYDGSAPLLASVHSYRRVFPEYATDTFFDVVPLNAKKQEPWGLRSQTPD